MQTLGRFLEALGVVIVPTALIVGHLAESMYQELAVMGVGAILFWTGHALASRGD